MTKVINLYGSPCSGKSTIASGLFYQMKIDGYNVELASEWIKGKVYEEAKYPFTDQLYVFANQHKMIRQMVGKVDYIICDSPLLQTCIYQTREPEIYDDMAFAYYNLYDNIDIILERTHQYQNEGRVHTEEQSKDIDKRIVDFLEKLHVNYIKLSTTNAMEEIYNIIEESENA